MSLPPQVKIPADVTAYSVVVSTIMGWLPAIAALASIVWIGVQLYYFLKDKWSKK